MNKLRPLFILVILSILTACQQPLETAVFDGTVTPAEVETAEVVSTPTLSASPINQPSTEPEAVSSPSETTSTYPLPAFPESEALLVQLDASVVAEDFLPQLPIIVHFNQPINNSSSGRPLLISPNTSGKIEWHNNKQTLVFIPTKSLQSNRNYTLALNVGLRSETGQKLDNVQRWQIKTMNVPKISAITPSARLINAFQPAFQITFNQAMNRESVRDALSLSPSISFESSWSENTLHLTLNEDLTFGSSYHLAIDETAVNLDNISIQEPFEHQFELLPPIQTADLYSQSNYAQHVAIDWNYPIDIENFAEIVSFSPQINGRWAWNETNDRVTFQPDDPFPPEAVVNLTFLNDVPSINGRILPAPEPISFTTQSAIVSTSPADARATKEQSIRIQFDRPMDQASVEAAFTLEPNLPGSFEWQNNELIFTPNQAYFDFEQTYSYRLAASAKTATGALILNQDQEWAFTTARFEPWADFGDGPNVQVVDANGRRAIQYRSRLSSIVSLNFKMHPYSPETFIDLFTSEFQTQWWEHEGEVFELPETEQQPYQWTAETIEPFNEWNHVQELIIPDEVPPGLYVLEIDTGRTHDQLFVVLSENSVVAKVAEDQTAVWVRGISGDSVANEPVQIRDRDGNVIASGTTNQNGVAYFDLVLDSHNLDTAQSPFLIVAGTGTNITLSGLDDTWRGGWYWWSETRIPDRNNYAIYGYTDRPIYKPGQTIFFKGIIRQDIDGVIDIVPEETAVTVRIRDARQNVVQTFEMETNHFGTVHGEFNLADGAMLGVYNVEYIIDGEAHLAAFKVEEYRKPDYEITLETDASAYVIGDEITLAIQADYFFGEPVTHAEVTVRQFRLIETYSWMENQGDYIWETEYGRADIPGRLDENGHLVLTIPAETNFQNYYYGYGNTLQSQTLGLEVTVNDGSNQTVSNFAVVDVFNQSVEISVNRDRYVYPPDAPIDLDIEVMDINGRPQANQSIELTIRRYNLETYGFDTILKQIDLTTDANGRIAYRLNDVEPGYMQIRVTGKDSNRNDIANTTGIYVYDPDQASWYGQDDQITITTEQESFAPGDTAVLFIESSFSGPALLTVERGTVWRELPVDLTAPLTRIELPIIETDTPNIHVTLNVYKPQTVTELSENVYMSLADATVLRQSINLNVPAVNKQLNVTITPNQSTYAPGEEAAFTIRVTNQAGVPVSAELSAALVDEAIFALSEELNGPIFDGFYFTREHLVQNFHSLAPFRWLGGGGGGGGGGDGGIQGAPRADFQDTAVWLPTLYTDFNGEAEVSLTLPDNLTRWRMTVKAATADTQVGEAIESIVTEKPVLVRPLLPNIVTSGDTLALSALIHNYSSRSQTLTVGISEVDTERLTFQGDVEQTITLSPNEVRLVGWTAVADSEGEIALLVTAVTPDNILADGVQLPLMIQPLAIPDVETAVGEFRTQLTTKVTIPADALEMSEVKIELSRSIAGSMLQGLEDLTGYPYGCVEQTMSKALPNAVVGRAINRLGIDDPTLAAELPGQINASIQKLYGFQHDDGGWGWWYDDNTQLYQTAWVLFGLSTIVEAGYEVDPTVLERGALYLNENLNHMDAKTKAFALYSMALAGHGSLESTRALAQSTDELDPFALAALALTFEELGDHTNALRILGDLEERAVTRNGRVSFPGAGDDGAYDRKTMASTVRNTGFALSAFAQIQPGHTLESGMVRYMMAERRPFGWGTTNETAFAIIGLTDHLLASGFSEDSQPVNYIVMLNGNPFTLGTLDAGAPSTTLVIPRIALDAGENEITISQEGANQLYYIVNSRTYQAQAAIEADGNIEVSRTYLDPETNQPLSNNELTAGQLVRVSLQVFTPDSLSYVIIEDKVPAGLEPLNERLNTSSHEGQAYIERTTRWENYGYNQKEIRADSVTFFVTELRPGAHVITYYARVTTAGTVTAMPTEVYAMYDLSQWGRSASDTLVILEK